MRRVGNAWFPLGGNEVAIEGISGFVAIEKGLRNSGPSHHNVRPLRLAQNGTFPFWKCYDRCRPDAPKGVTCVPKEQRKMRAINKKRMHNRLG